MFLFWTDEPQGDDDVTTADAEFFANYYDVTFLKIKFLI
jgi:hypothetical protein